MRLSGIRERRHQPFWDTAMSSLFEDEWECSKFSCNWRYKKQYVEDIHYRCASCGAKLIKQPSQKILSEILTTLEECQEKVGWNFRSAWDYYLNSLEKHIGIKSGRDLDRTINTCDLAPRTNNVLKKAGISYLYQLVRLTKEELKQIKNVGKKSIKEIVAELENINLRLGMGKKLDKGTIELYEVTADKAEEIGDFHLARELRRSARNFCYEGE